jgi:integrase
MKRQSSPRILSFSGDDIGPERTNNAIFRLLSINDKVKKGVYNFIRSADSSPGTQKLYEKSNGAAESREDVGTQRLLNPTEVAKILNMSASMVYRIIHDLRHTAASLMLNHRVPVIVVSKVLGHSKPSVTFDIYAHLYNEMQDEAARVMDRITTLTPVAFLEKNER